MSYSTTFDVLVQVETMYQGIQHRPASGVEYVFAYRITIINNSPNDVQLLSRYWLITDGYGEPKIVEGAGVIGEQPIIQAGRSYQYVSGTSFPTKIGKMEGYYNMTRLLDNQAFQVEINEFHMTTPDLLN
jgi:ApaG protein